MTYKMIALPLVLMHAQGNNKTCCESQRHTNNIIGKNSLASICVGDIELSIVFGIIELHFKGFQSVTNKICHWSDANFELSAVCLYGLYRECSPPLSYIINSCMVVPYWWSSYQTLFSPPLLKKQVDVLPSKTNGKYHTAKETVKLEFKETLI